MSTRLEWLTATETTPDLLRRGDEASDHTEVTGPFALVLGYPGGAIIEGSLPELWATTTPSMKPCATRSAPR